MVAGYGNFSKKRLTSYLIDAVASPSFFIEENYVFQTEGVKTERIHRTKNTDSLKKITVSTRSYHFTWYLDLSTLFTYNSLIQWYDKSWYQTMVKILVAKNTRYVRWSHSNHLIHQECSHMVQSADLTRELRF